MPVRPTEISKIDLVIGGIEDHKSPTIGIINLNYNKLMA